MVDKKSQRKCTIEIFRIFEAILNAAQPLTAKDIAIITGIDPKIVLKILKNDRLTKLPFFEKNNITVNNNNYRWSVSQYGFNYIQQCQFNSSIDIVNLQQNARQYQSMEQDFSAKLKLEKDMLLDQKGVDKFFTPDLSNSIDREILLRLRSQIQKYPAGEERRCRIILARRIKGKGISLGREKEKTDTIIKNRIEIMCIRQNRLWNDIVRELFAIEFNLKPLPVPLPV